MCGSAARFRWFWLLSLGASPQKWAQPELYRWIAGTHVTRIPWDAVDHVSAMVHLKKSADVAGLFRGDQLAGRVLERIPGS